MGGGLIWNWGFNVYFWVVQWDRYNKKRKDVKDPTCFAVSKDVFTDDKIIQLDHVEKCFFFYLLTLCRKDNSGIIAVTLAHAKQVGQFTDQQINQASTQLKAVGLIRAVEPKEYERYVHVTSTLRARDVAVGGTPFPPHPLIPESSINSQSSFSSSSSLKKSSDEEFTLEQQEGRAWVPEFKSIGEILVAREVPLQIQKQWLEAFPDPKWIVAEIRKMLAWEEVNTKKKRFGRFAHNWLTRGWDRRPSQGNKPKRDWSFLKDGGQA